jgi:hypothetical protein
MRPRPLAALALRSASSCATISFVGVSSDDDSRFQRLEIELNELADSEVVCRCQELAVPVGTLRSLELRCSGGRLVGGDAGEVVSTPTGGHEIESIEPLAASPAAAAVVAAGVVAAAAAAESPNVLVTAFNSSTCSDELLRQRGREKSASASADRAISTKKVGSGEYRSRR